MACRGLLSLLCATVWLVYAAARTSVHSRFTNGNPSAATEPSETWPRTECSLYRSAAQQTIDKAYVLQRAKLEQAIAQLPQNLVASWDTREAWHVWELFPPIYNCVSKEKLGNQPQDGGKFVCGVDSLLQHPRCTVFSFGSQEDILARTPCTVHTFDPTLNEGMRNRMLGNPSIKLHEFGLGPADGRQIIAGIDAEIKTLPSIMAELDVQWVDLLKIDIEGSEWAVLRSIIDYYGDRLPFTQLQIEIHFEAMYGINALEALHIMQHLEKAGLRVFSMEYNFLAGDRVAGYLEYSFINRRDCRTVV